MSPKWATLMNLTIRNGYLMYILSVFTKINLSGFGVTEYSIPFHRVHISILSFGKKIFNFEKARYCPIPHL